MKGTAKLKVVEGVDWIPKGFHTVTPDLMVRDFDRAIDWYKKAFGAECLYRWKSPDERCPGYAQLRIGDSYLFLCEYHESRGKWEGGSGWHWSPVTLHLYVKDVDAAYDKAIAAGAKPKLPVEDMYWGDRYGKVVDPFGYEWGLGTHKEDLSTGEIERRAREYYLKKKAG